MQTQAIATVLAAALSLLCTHTLAQNDRETEIKIETKDNLRDNLFAGRIILNNASNSDVILDQIPGRLCVTYVDDDGNRIIKNFGQRPLAKDTKPPTINIKSQNLRNSIIQADASAAVGFLSFVNIKGSDASYINYRVDRTATAKVNEAQIDWDKAGAMVKQLKDSKNYPEQADYFIAQVVSTIAVHASLLRETEIRGKAAAFGLQAGGDFFAKFSDEKNEMLFEITPVFIFPFEVPEVAAILDSVESNIRAEEEQYIATLASKTHSTKISNMTDEQLQEYLLPLAQGFAARSIFPSSNTLPADEVLSPTEFQFKD